MASRQKKAIINFERLIGSLNFGIFRQTPDLSSHFVYANPVLLRMLSYTEKSIHGVRVFDVFLNKREFRRLREEALKRGSAMSDEVKLISQRRHVMICSVTLVAVRDTKGNIQFIDGVLKDITQEKLAEKSIQESRELFETVFTNSAAAIIVTGKDERIVAWNPFVERMLEWKKKELFNKEIKTIYPGHEWQQMRRLQIREGDVLAEVETQVLRRNGTLVDVNMSYSRIRDMNGNDGGAIRIFHDITKLKTAEHKIKESENKIRVILDNSAAAITLIDEKERIISWNKYTEDLLGLTRKDLYLKPVSIFYPPEEWEKIRQANIRKGGGRHHLETRVIAKGKEPIDVALSINLLKDSAGDIVGAVGIMQDITQQKQVQRMLLRAKEEAEDANRAKTMFLANMSHEIRTPMSTIMGMADLTLDTNLNDEQKDNLLTIKNAADVLLSLLNDILDLSRVESGKIELEEIEINLYNILKSVLKGLSVLSNNKGIPLELTVDPQLPDVLLGDPVRIRQILVNLINNAIKFTFKGKITTSVKVVSQDEAFTLLEFAVKDAGVGIPDSKKDRIFDVFQQADSSTTRKFGGTGLGLAISKRLVELMAGRIWVESEEFKGSTFYFTARFKNVKKQDEVKTPAILVEAGASQPVQAIQSLSILVAEDNLVNQRIVVRMLEKKGWKAKAVSDGQEVLDALKNESFDLILMDAQMPNIDGFEATRRVREMEGPAGRHTAIIALTARAMTDDRRKCIECGMDGYISKPIDREQFFQTIENYFNQRKEP